MKKHNDRLFFDYIFKLFVKGTGALTIAVLAGIFLMLLWNSISFFLKTSPIDFFTGFTWDPETHFGMIPMILSTLLVSLGAMVIAIPLGVLTALFMSELAPPILQNILKPLIELLAAIPSVVIGFLGIVFLGPNLAHIFSIHNGLNALNGSILLAIMSLPTIITISEDSLHAVPMLYKEASLGLGANKWQTMYKVTLPAAMPGIIAAILLGLGRALGETMTVLMATGNALSTPTGYLDSIRTITATIAIEMGEVPYQTTHYFALFALAAVLFIFSLVINLIGEQLASKLRNFQ